MTNTPDKSELLPCRECGAPCSPELFPVHCGEPCDTTIWMCSQHRFLGGKCSSETAYLTKTAWNTRVPDMVEDSDDYCGPMFESVCREIERTCPEVTAGVRGFLARRITMLIERAALQAVPASGGVGWQPIESAPKDGTPVLLGYLRENLDGSIYQEGGAPVVAAWIPTKKLADDGAEVNWVSLGERLRSSRSFSPTHWHPLPAPPALKASGEE